MWICLTLKANISASSNVTVRASDFTFYSLFMPHANRPQRDRRIRVPSPVLSCYESLESTIVQTTVCQWIQSWASCTHFQPSTNFWSIRPSVQQRRLLCLPINCFLRCSSTKILYVFLASPSELTARTFNLGNFITITILSDLKISCSSSSCGTPIDSLHLTADASSIRKKNIYFSNFASPGVVLMRTNEPLRTSEWDRFITSVTVRRLGKKFWLFVVADVQYIFLDITVAPSNNKASTKTNFRLLSCLKNE
jgi:hypothetical protein